MDPGGRVSAGLVASARAFAEDARTPAEPRAASTVVLLRGGDGEQGGVEVCLLRRVRSMAFAGGFCVFPGGRVDERDSDQAVTWAGPSTGAWAEVLGTSEDQARALVCAAVRETFEESGVLLAGPTAETLVADTTGADWEEDRRRLEARQRAFTDVLTDRGLSLRTDLLAFWGRWLTPVFEPRRYDTRFFVAALPQGQSTRDVSTESDQVVWLPVRDALRAVDAGDLAMLPPTFVTCLQLYDARTPEEAVASAAVRDRSVVLPTVQLTETGGHLRLPESLVELGASVAARLGTRP